MEEGRDGRCHMKLSFADVHAHTELGMHHGQVQGCSQLKAVLAPLKATFLEATRHRLHCPCR